VSDEETNVPLIPDEVATPEEVAEEEAEAPQVPIPENVQTRNALVNLIEHGMKQASVVSGMIGQAELALEKARAAQNSGPGNVLKMIIPVMIGRKRYLESELRLWSLVLDAAGADLDELGDVIEDVEPPSNG
jgi:hypothetical protein